MIVLFIDRPRFSPFCLRNGQIPVTASGRIDRIAAALPDVRIRIAKEELSRPVESAMVVLDPIMTPKGEWITGIHVMDAANKTRSTYLVSAKGSQDKEIACLASGVVFGTDPNALSFKTLAGFSSDIGIPTPLPPYVQEQNSYVLHTSSASFAKTLEDILRGRTVIEQTAPISTDFSTWTNLVAELTKNREQYMLNKVDPTSFPRFKMPSKGKKGPGVGIETKGGK